MTGLLFPDVPAMVTVTDGGPARVVHAGAGWVTTLDGELSADVAELVSSGAVPPRLRALAGTIAAIEQLLAWLEGRSVPLTAANAIQLDGFGTLFVELVGQCNERCVHCYASSSPEIRAHLDRDVCEAIIDDAATLGVRRLQLTGGDPLLCDFLPALVDRATASAIESVEIYTNGLLLSDRLLTRLAPAQPSFAFSFYSSDPDVHDAITRTPGSQRRTLAAIRRAVGARLAVRASVVVMEGNAHTVDETVAVLRESGVGFVGVSTSFQVGRGEHFPGEVTVGSTDGHRRTASGARVSVSGKLCVTYDGNVVPCIFNRDAVLGNVAQRRLTDIVRDPAPRGRRFLSNEQALQACRTSLQCSSCRLTSVALYAQGG